ncbi:MAG: PilZ domain-containing protein [Acidobacteria bacterium]|nr:PilZ domain-containing protein [Acidobacteriota bacterium]
MQSEGKLHRKSVDRTWPRSESRVHRRVPLGVPIECHSSTKITGIAENISVGGVLVRAKDTLPWDELVTVSFSLPGSPETLQIGARVTHVVPEMFLGLEFRECPAELKQRIEAYVRSIPESQPNRK